jgi:hypothetical protein
MKTYCHGGGFGDVVYSIPAYRIGAFERYMLMPSGYRAEQGFRPEVVSTLLAFEGCYVERFSGRGVFVPPRGWVNGDRFRDRVFAGVGAGDGRFRNIVEQHVAALGGGVVWRSAPWLHSRARRVADVLFVRSARYRPVVCRVDWRRLAKLFAGRCGFVGLFDEWWDFCAEFGVSVPWFEPLHFQEAAEWFAGARLVVHNQTGLGAVAAGLGVQRVLEVCERVDDCRLGWSNEFVSSREWAHGAGLDFVWPSDERILGELRQGFVE